MTAKLIKISKKVVSKEDPKKELNYTNYYLELPSGQYVAIKPAFKNDYKVLYVVASDPKKQESPF